MSLIQQLLSCPSGEEPQILAENVQLLDQGFLQACEAVAEKLTRQGQENNANFLRNLAVHLGQGMGKSPASTNDIFQFLMQVLQTTSESDSNPQVVYPLLAANKEKLNLTLAQVLRDWATQTLPAVESTQAYRIAVDVVNFSNLIQQFPLGNKANNIEIAIAGYKVALSVFTQSAFPQEWATTQNNLGNAYSDRIIGEKAANIESAIACYNAALQVYTQTNFPQEWAMTQNNLGAAYKDRIIGEKAANIESAIACYNAALQVRTQSAFPQEWASTQNNLGNAYSDRIIGEKAANIESAIACYNAALQVRTQSAFPQEWASTQNNLGNAYSDRIIGEKAANIESAIAYYNKALQVRTQSAFPQEWATTQNNLGNAYSDRIIGEKAANIESAIAYYTKALQVRTQSAFPQEWAMTQNNLGNAYSDRIIGEKVANIESAIACYTKALQVRTQSAFPQNHAETLLNLGLAYQDIRQFNQAYQNFAAAIDTVEFLRSEIDSGNESKQKLAEKYNQIYQRIVKVCLELGKYTEAVEYVERSKARNLVELLALRDLYLKGEIPEQVRTQLKQLRQEIAVEKRRLAANTHSDPTHLNHLREEYNRLFPFQPINYPDIQQLLDDRTAIVEWYILDDTFLTFVMTSDALQSDKNSTPHLIGETQTLQVLQSSKTDFDALIDWLKKYLVAYLENRTNWQKQLMLYLEELAQILHLDKILACLPSTVEQLVLVPHRFLHLLPLHALPISFKQNAGSQNNQCLLDLFVGGVKYTPSCQLLQQANSQQRPNFTHLFAIQNPTEDLDFTDIEVEAIQQQFYSYKVLKGKDACKSKFEQLQNTYLRETHCVHFSCHGYFNFESPLNSALLLAGATDSALLQQTNAIHETPFRDSSTINLENCFTLADIFNLDLNKCRLVTLSACESGLTDFISLSDEYISLPSGFLIAGSPSVVASLWAVNDFPTALLMIKFYDNLKNYISVDIALNMAQLWLRDITRAELKQWLWQQQLKRVSLLFIQKILNICKDDERPFQSPVYWAGFCAIGKS